MILMWVYKLIDCRVTLVLIYEVHIKYMMFFQELQMFCISLLPTVPTTGLVKDYVFRI